MHVALKTINHGFTPTNIGFTLTRKSFTLTNKGFTLMSKGDIYIYGESKMQGVLVGIPIKKYTMLNILLSSFSYSLPP